MALKFCVIVALVIHFYEIWAYSDKNLETFVTLASNVQNFYKSSSVIMVYDVHSNGLNVGMNILNAMKKFSRNFILSQALTYDDLRRTKRYQKNIYFGSSMEPLFVVFIDNRENFEHFKNLTKEWNMSIHTWFVIIQNRNDMDCDEPPGNPFNLAMDTRMMVKCDGVSSIKKYYAIFKNVTEVVDLATWTPEKKIVFKNDDNLIQVKKNMKGITLKIAKQRRLTTIFNQNIANYLNELMNTLATVSNFKTATVIEHDQLGYFNKTTKQWVGLMKILSDKRVDVALALFSMSISRLAISDFSMPLMRAKSAFYTKLPNRTTIRWSAYFEVFNTNAWTTIGFAILFLSVSLALTKSIVEGLSVSTNLLLDNFMSVWGIYCQQGLTETPSNMPTQLVYFSILNMSFIIYSIYSATITSYIAILTADLPFATYEQFKLAKDYKVTLLKDSRDELLIHSNDWLLSPLESRLRPHEELPTNGYEGFLQACEEKIAFYTNDVVFDGISKITPCILGSVKVKRIENQAIALRKDSPYTKSINYYILRLMNHGILMRLKKAYFYKFKKSPDSKPNKLTLWEIMPILAIWAGGIIASLVVLIAELIYWALRH